MFVTVGNGARFCPRKNGTRGLTIGDALVMPSLDERSLVSAFVLISAPFGDDLQLRLATAGARYHDAGSPRFLHGHLRGAAAASTARPAAVAAGVSAEGSAEEEHARLRRRTSPRRISPPLAYRHLISPRLAYQHLISPRRAFPRRIFSATIFSAAFRSPCGAALDCCSSHCAAALGAADGAAAPRQRPIDAVGAHIGGAPRSTCRTSRPATRPPRLRARRRKRRSWRPRAAQPVLRQSPCGDARDFQRSLGAFAMSGITATSVRS